jgi:hypothetical protein
MDKPTFRRIIMVPEPPKPTAPAAIAHFIWPTDQASDKACAEANAKLTPLAVPENDGLLTYAELPPSELRGKHRSRGIRINGKSYWMAKNGSVRHTAMGVRDGQDLLLYGALLSPEDAAVVRAAAARTAARQASKRAYRARRDMGLRKTPGGWE